MKNFMETNCLNFLSLSLIFCFNENQKDNLVLKKLFFSLKKSKRKLVHGLYLQKHWPKISLLTITTSTPQARLSPYMFRIEGNIDFSSRHNSSSDNSYLFWSRPPLYPQVDRAAVTAFLRGSKDTVVLLL